jgi:hypothetical protein
VKDPVPRCEINETRLANAATALEIAARQREITPTWREIAAMRRRRSGIALPVRRSRGALLPRRRARS